MPAFSPQPFGKYYLVDKLAVGGMAEVFLARPPQGGTSGPSYLAIKRILPHFSNNSQFIDMFIDEAKISVQLEHPNIVPVFDLGKIGDTYFLAMEFVAGQDVKAIVARCKDRGLRLSYEHAAYIVSELLQGLDYAHKKADRSGRGLGIVHRDISPQNVLVGYDGAVKITDFGIAKAESKLDSTQVGTLKGKFGYMAPEQVVAGGPPLDHRSDLFAAGVILWELVTGHRLFTGTSEIEILERVRAAKFDPPSAIVPDVPRELERIVFKSLMKDRDRRYSTAWEMHLDLAKFLESHGNGFSPAEMAGVMEELFAAEIATVKTKWNVVIGPVIDRTKVERGAATESTRPDQTRVADDVELPTTTTAVPPIESRPRRTDDRTNVEPPREPVRTRIATPPPLTPASRTTIQDIAERPRPGAAASLSPEALLEGMSPFESGVEDPSKTYLSSSMPAAKPKKTPAPAPPPPAKAPAWKGPSGSTALPPPPPPPRTIDSDFAVTDEREVAPRERTSTAATRRKGGGGARVALVFLGLLVAGGAAFGAAWMGVFPNPLAPPVLRINASVDGTSISVDGVPVVLSGKTVEMKVATGDRLVEVKKDLYLPFKQQISAARGGHPVVEAAMVPLPDAKADIPVITDPTGATVTVDGTAVDGTTPLTLHLRMGKHDVAAHKEGFADARVPLETGAPGSGAAVSLKLAPTAASVRVESTPAGAQVSIDGVAKGSTPITMNGLDVGKPIAVAVALPGFVTETRTVTPPGGVDPLALILTLNRVAEESATPAASSKIATPTPTPIVLGPDKGLLTIEVEGGWGVVEVDGVPFAQRTPVSKAPIAAGDHRVRVFNPVTGHEKIFDILVTAGRNATKKVSLDH